MAKLTEVVEVTTNAVSPSGINPADAVAEFKRVCQERGLVVEDEPAATLTSFVVGQKARFSVSAECKSANETLKKSAPKETA